jgi:hypothetical protein
LQIFVPSLEATIAKEPAFTGGRAVVCWCSCRGIFLIKPTHVSIVCFGIGAGCVERLFDGVSGARDIAGAFEDLNAGAIKADTRTMIAMTTISSIRLKASWARFDASRRSDSIIAMKARRPMDEKKETELKHSRLKFVMIELSKGKTALLQKLKRLNVSPIQKRSRRSSRSLTQICFAERPPVLRRDLRSLLLGKRTTILEPGRHLRKLGRLGREAAETPNAVLRGDSSEIQ